MAGQVLVLGFNPFFHFLIPSFPLPLQVKQQPTPPHGSFQLLAFLFLFFGFRGFGLLVLGTVIILLSWSPSVSVHAVLSPASRTRFSPTSNPVRPSPLLSDTYTPPYTRPLNVQLCSTPNIVWFALGKRKKLGSKYSNPHPVINHRNSGRVSSIYLCTGWLVGITQTFFPCLAFKRRPTSSFLIW